MKIFSLLFTVSVLFLSHSPASAMLSTLRQEEKIETVRNVQKKINEKVNETALKTYQKINSNWTYVKPNEEMSVDSPYWEAKWIMGESYEGKKQKTRIPTLVLKTSPDKIEEALEDLINKPASLECTIALNTAKLFCIKEILNEFGKNTFTGFSTIFYNLLDETEGWSIEQFFHELPEQFLTRVEGKEIPGSICYITNIPDYGYYKPNGNGRGSNVFCMKNNQYLGFSSIYKKGPQSLETIVNQDRDLFLDTQDVERGQESHSILSKQLKETKGLFEELRQKEQKKNCNFHIIFDAKKFIGFQHSRKVLLMDGS